MKASLCGIALLSVLPGTAFAGTQPFASADAARALVQALQRDNLDTIAVADPDDPGAFIAALYIPGGQLLVVSADHPSVDGVAQRIAARQYREVYLDLQGTPTPQGKFFVQDARADGLLSAVDGSGDVDVIYEDGVSRTLFNGDARAQKLKPAEYDARLAAADRRYARMLTLLAAAVDAAP